MENSDHFTGASSPGSKQDDPSVKEESMKNEKGLDSARRRNGKVEVLRSGTSEHKNLSESSLPRNCSYETKKFDWKKVYSPPEGGKGKMVLLKDQRCETEFSYTRGSMDSQGDVTVSDTDIISHGLKVLLKVQDKSVKDIQLPNLKRVLNLMQLSPEELTSVQEWLNQKYELSVKYEREIQALLAFVKKVLAEVKLLRKSIAKYRQKISKLEKEVNLHPRAEVILDLHKECERLRKAIIKLDQEHATVSKSKDQLRRSLQMEFENSSKSDDSIYIKIQSLKYENKTLQHLIEVFVSEAREVSNNLIKQYEASSKTARKLDGLLFRARALLEKKSAQTKEIQNHLKDQEKLVQNNADSISFIQFRLGSLKSDAEDMQTKSTSLASHAVNLQNEIHELLANFNSIMKHITSKKDVEAEKKKNMSQIKDILNNVSIQQKNVKRLENNIIRLENHIQSLESKDRKGGVDIVVSSSKENAYERQTWENKMSRFHSHFEEMDEVIVHIREEENAKKEAIKEASKKETIGQAFLNTGEETLKLSGRFICSDATAGEVVTKSGVCNIAETILSKEGGMESDSPKYERGVKSVYSVGLQDLKSVPESASSQLHGIYTKYKLKDSEEGRAASSE